ncbi:MAG: hypothetical protein H7A46_25215 [Verrucomicrobiales bacterium]|nr:hypothetical protein [Verrucomicrobiales bacterium]
MNELVFEVEQDGEWLVATCHFPEMATQAATFDELAPMVRDLVACRFEPGEARRTWPIRVHFVEDAVRAGAWNCPAMSEFP